MRPTEIYTLTTVYFGEKLDYEPRPRLWNWFPTKAEAIKCAIESADFYSECGYYTHIVIERVKDMGLPYDLHPTWLELRELPEPKEVEYIDENGTEGTIFRVSYEAVEVGPPAKAAHTVGWGIG